MFNYSKSYIKIILLFSLAICFNQMPSNSYAMSAWKESCDRNGWRASAELGTAIASLVFGIFARTDAQKWSEGKKVSLDQKNLLKLFFNITRLANNILFINNRTSDVIPHMHTGTWLVVDALEIISNVGQHIFSVEGPVCFEEEIKELEKAYLGTGLVSLRAGYLRLLRGFAGLAGMPALAAQSFLIGRALFDPNLRGSSDVEGCEKWKLYNSLASGCSSLGELGFACLSTSEEADIKKIIFLLSTFYHGASIKKELVKI